MAVHLCDETLFCLKERRYPARAAKALFWALRNYDAVICLGRMEADLARSLLSDHRTPLICETQGGLLRERQETLLEVQPALDSGTILFTGSGPNEWRGWYKGLDLLIQAGGIASNKIAEVKLCIIGQWDAEYIESLTSRMPTSVPPMELPGAFWKLPDYARRLSEAALYVHLGRGDAFPLSVLEAMCAGLPCIVSEWTGTREAVEQVDPRLVVPCDARIAGERILWYLNLPLDAKQALSARSREVAAQYTEDRAIESFVGAFNQILRHFDLPDLPQEVIGHGFHADRSRWWPSQE